MYIIFTLHIIIMIVIGLGISINQARFQNWKATNEKSESIFIFA